MFYKKSFGFHFLDGKDETEDDMVEMRLKMMTAILADDHDWLRMEKCC